MNKKTDNSKYSLGIEKAYKENKYIVNYYTVYQPFYSVNAGYYALPVYKSHEGNLTLRGRYFHKTAKDVNRLIGFELLAELNN